MPSEKQYLEDKAEIRMLVIKCQGGKFWTKCDEFEELYGEDELANLLQEIEDEQSGL